MRSPMDNEGLLKWMGIEPDSHTTVIGGDLHTYDIWPDLRDKHNMWMLWEYGVKKLDDNSVEFYRYKDGDWLCTLGHIDCINKEPHLALLEALKQVAESEASCKS